MSELPWENKKIAEIMSSADEASKLSVTDNSGNSKSTLPPIPDILANAFADIPMEEAKIEVSEDAVFSMANEARMPPSFGNLPDLSMPGGIDSDSNLSQSKSVSSPSSDALPPFLNNLNAANSHEKNEGSVADTPKPLFDPEKSTAGKNTSGPSLKGAASHSGKRSPPPLFEPFIPHDNDTISSMGSEGHTQTLPGTDPGLASPPGTISSLEELKDPGVNPFISTPPVNLPPSGTRSGDAGPFGSGPGIANQSHAKLSFPNPSDAAPVAFNPFSNDQQNLNPLRNDQSITNPFVENPAGANPFANIPRDANPFETGPSVPAPTDVSSVGFNPFSPGQDNANPPQNDQSVPNPFGPNSGGDNPFANASQGSNPFSSGPASSGSVISDPFANEPGVSNPFANEPGVSNPFARPAAGTGMYSENGTGLQKASRQQINVDSLKKNIEGLSVVARDLFRNLTKGKSLIERVEDMRGSTIGDDLYSGEDSNTMPGSPFDDEPEINRVDPLTDPFSSPFEKMEQVDKPKDSASFTGSDPFAATIDTEPASDIRKVTPIENPVMEMKPEYQVDENLSQNPFAPLSHDAGSEPSHETVDIMGMGTGGEAEVADFAQKHSINGEGNFSDVSDGSLQHVTVGENKVSSSSSALATEMTPATAEGAITIEDKKITSLEDELSSFKENISGMDMQFDSIRDDVEKISGKVLDIDRNFSSFVKSSEEAMSQTAVKFAGLEEKVDSFDGRIGGFESSLDALQIDNLSIRSDLSRIEENISELVNSYTALLGQLHESVQENGSNFSRLDSMSAKLDEIGSRMGSVEKSQEGTRATSMEFSRSISTLVDGLGKMSSEFVEFRQQSEQKNAEILERIDSVTEYVDNEMKKLGAKSYKGFGQNVHLSNIVKNSSNMKLCMEWLEFLMELVGRNNLPDILSYYEELGWLTEKVRMELLNYAEGIDFYMEKPDWKLTPDDHVKSIWFIESLAGMKVDKNRLSVIDRDIEKVRKGSEIYGI
ncbi:FlaD/FlaE family flagellar protein [Methanolobus sp. WCC5]|uniref:FlaD/FlaE family flagellar protein n=1 Tax=Methanolobus sp. WCC5 TaxID=3125785 RepID=UPI003254AB3D